MTKCGYIAIAGQPNVGKSTLINGLMKKKVAIISEKPETTRDAICGILTEGDSQMIFIDTPGIHKPKNLLGKIMTTQARSSVLEADIILFLIEKRAAFTREDMNIISLLPEKKDKKTVILIINKTDRIKDKPSLLPLMEKAARLYPFDEIVPMSALDQKHIDALHSLITKYLPEKDHIFASDKITDRDEDFMTKEIIREKILIESYDEVPHSVAVTIDQKNDEGTIIRIHATIIVERESQKTIIIGKNGSMIKKIGTSARRELEKLLNKRVYLDLWVKPVKDWKKDTEALRDVGYISG
ncbi:MAG: GTPase Era [Candidatus Omnitrophica bacterium]|nr:GTPase Era [Candidatus Omnitrophota bacterium]